MREDGADASFLLRQIGLYLRLAEATYDDDVKVELNQLADTLAEQAVELGIDPRLLKVAKGDA